MLSMINPDSLTRFESHSKFSTTNMVGGVETGGFYEQHHHEGSAQKGSKLMGFPATKTSTNFYPSG